jgi:hypothetical protein
VACFAKNEPSVERWRVVLEDKDKRLKVYPDGRTEQFNGTRNFPPHSKVIEFMQLVPSRDQSKIDAAASVFHWYATERIGFSTLARRLNALGFRTCFGRPFQGYQIEAMLADPVYTGWPVWNRKHVGKFHRFRNGDVIWEPYPEEKQTANVKADWIPCQHQLFPTLVDPKTWTAVQTKLEKRGCRKLASRSHRHYLAKLVYCGHCNRGMYCGPGRRGRLEYFCATYSDCVKNSGAKDSQCYRNCVKQDELEPYIERYLEEVKIRLEIFTDRLHADNSSDR